MQSLVNVISRLMSSNFNVPFTKDFYVKIIGYCYHSVHVITLVWPKVITLSGFLLYRQPPSLYVAFKAAILQKLSYNLVCLNANLLLSLIYLGPYLSQITRETCIEFVHILIIIPVFL